MILAAFALWLLVGFVSGVIFGWAVAYRRVGPPPDPRGSRGADL